MMHDTEKDIFKWDLDFLLDLHEVSLDFSSEAADKEFEKMKHEFVEKWIN